VTAVFDGPETVAVNSRVLPAATVAGFGEIVTVVFLTFTGVLEIFPEVVVDVAETRYVPEAVGAV
jgi:hypothetical protein